MNKIDTKYLDVLDDILTYGYEYNDPNRPGVTRKELETVIINHLINDGYPILSVRKTFFKGAVGELLLFLKGKNDIRRYWDYNIHFWDKDWARFNHFDEDYAKQLKEAYKNDPSYKTSYNTLYNLGKIYPLQYEKQYDVFDKFKENVLRTDLVVDTWQVEDLKDMALIPCHFGFQILGSTDGFKICWFQRSTDFMLGTPINVQYYYLMGMLLEAWSGHRFLGITGILNKCHLYNNQIDLAKKMMGTRGFTSNARVELTVDPSLKQFSFAEFIKNIEPSNFKLLDYEYLLDESVEMLTYTK